MRILLTVHQFLPEYSAGTEVLTLGTAKDLQARGHEVAVFTGYPALTKPRPDQRFDSYVYDGIEVQRYHHSYLPLDGQSTTDMEYNNLLLGRQFRTYLKRLKPDVVHFFHLGRLSASPVDICQALSIPMVLTPTDFWFVCPTNQLRLPNNEMCSGPQGVGTNCLRHLVALNQPAATRRQLEKIPDWMLGLLMRGVSWGLFSNKWFAPHVRGLARRPAFMRERINKIDRVLVPTRLMERILIANGLKPEKITFAPYGIDLGHPQLIPPGTAGDVLRVGFIGTLYEHKGPHVLLQAVKQLPASIPVQVKIYGNLSEFPAYVEKMKELAGDDGRIQFCGTFPNHEIGDVFSQLDVLVVPSLWYENTPLVIYHAQAFQCPVIASNLGGMAEAVGHGENGLLFPAGSSSELASLLQRLATERGLLQQLKEQVRKPRSISEYVEQVETVYCELQSRRLPTRAKAAARVKSLQEPAASGSRQ